MCVYTPLWEIYKFAKYIMCCVYVTCTHTHLGMEFLVGSLLHLDWNLNWGFHLRRIFFMLIVLPPPTAFCMRSQDQEFEGSFTDWLPRFLSSSRIPAHQKCSRCLQTLEELRLAEALSFHPRQSPNSSHTWAYYIWMDQEPQRWSSSSAELEISSSSP